jgi:hypothetical protein
MINVNNYINKDNKNEIFVCVISTQKKEKSVQTINNDLNTNGI